MTMLDRMRRHRAWLKWSLGIVVLTFILLYIPQLPPAGSGARPTARVATVDGRRSRWAAISAPTGSRWRSCGARTAT